MRNQQGGGGQGGAAASAAQGPPTEEGLRWEPLEAKHSEIGEWRTEPGSRLRGGVRAAPIVSGIPRLAHLVPKQLGETGGIISSIYRRQKLR